MSEAGSGIEGMRGDSAFARHVAERLQAEPFKLIDIGCAGGVAPGWRTFGAKLAALGFDADAGEVLRREVLSLNADLLVMGLYGRTRVGELLLGGVSDALLRDPPCALLLSH